MCFSLPLFVRVKQCGTAVRLLLLILLLLLPHPPKGQVWLSRFLAREREEINGGCGSKIRLAEFKGKGVEIYSLPSLLYSRSSSSTAHSSLAGALTRSALRATEERANQAKPPSSLIQIYFLARLPRPTRTYVCSILHLQSGAIYQSERANFETQAISGSASLLLVHK